MSVRGPTVEAWGPERLGTLTALCDAALPEEHLGVDDLEGVCFAGVEPHHDALRRGASVVLGHRDGTGALSATVTEVGEDRSAHVQLLVVHPDQRRRGVARALLRAAEQWALDQGVEELQAGGGAPYYLFTGVDTRWTHALCAFEALGYSRTAAELDLVCPTRRAHPSAIRDDVRAADVRSAAHHPDRVTAVRSDQDLAELCEFASRCWPLWAAEFRRGGAAGTAVLARSPDGAVIGAAAHSVSRLGVIGPVAVDPEIQRGGVGSALMARVLSDLAIAGLDRAEIAWTSTVRFYARSCDARVGRTSLQLRRRLPGTPDAAPRSTGSAIAFRP